MLMRKITFLYVKQDRGLLDAPHPEPFSWDSAWGPRLQLDEVQLPGVPSPGSAGTQLAGQSPLCHPIAAPLD